MENKMRTIDSFLADKLRFTPPFHIRYIDKKYFPQETTARLCCEHEKYEDEIAALERVSLLKEKYGAQYVDFIYDANGEEVSRHE
jgi:hypothetical protein